MNCNKCTISFQGRSRLVRDAQKICSTIRHSFPYPSETNLRARLDNGIVNNYTQNMDFSELFFNVKRRLCDMREAYRKESVFSIAKLVKEYRAANCGELSNLTGLTCLINGVRNVKTFMMYAYYKNNDTFRLIDHTVLGINFDIPPYIEMEKIPTVKKMEKDLVRAENEAIIIDSWLGIADYAKNYVTTIKNQFLDFLIGVYKDKGDELWFYPYHDLEKLSKDGLARFKRENPDLIIKGLQLNPKKKI